MLDARPLFGIYGASGCGRGIMPVARQQVDETNQPSVQLVFVDDEPPAEAINGHAVLTFDQFLEVESGSKSIAIAISNGKVREVLAKRVSEHGITHWAVRASNVVVMDQVTIGEGALLSPFVALTSNIKIGRYFHANLYSYVEHDCVIGDFVTFAPCVKCNGNVVIEDYAYIGAGAILRQGKPGQPLVIGRGATVGMGAVVTRSVPPGVTVVGNPARPIEKKP